MEENKEHKETAEEWKAGFDGLSFEDSAVRIKDKILESVEMDTTSRKYLNDAFNYVMSVYKDGKELDTNLMKIHMVDIKGYKELTINDFTKTLCLLSLCGFEFGYNGNNIKFKNK